MPVLFILGGPNGAGKTTFYFQAIKDGFINKELPFINVDLIAKNELGGYSDPNFVAAAEIARNRISTCLSAKMDFMIESNLAKVADYDWIINLQKAGYEIVLYFLCTSDILINVDRIERRVKEGGHYIPPHIVADRYRLCLVYLKSRLNIFKEAYLVDNTGQSIQELVVLAYGRIQNEISDKPQWAEDILSIVKKLNGLSP
jgi:predicted ABC-type ATPase